MTDEERIARMISGMRLGRKPPLSPAEKAAYAALEASCEEAMRALQKLHLRLWYAVKGDYASLPLDEARRLLYEAREKIDGALQKAPSEPK